MSCVDYQDALIHRCETVGNESVKWSRSRPKIAGKEIALENLQSGRIYVDLANDMAQWKKKIHISDIN